MLYLCSSKLSRNYFSRVWILLLYFYTIMFCFVFFLNSSVVVPLHISLHYWSIISIFKVIYWNYQPPTNNMSIPQRWKSKHLKVKYGSKNIILSFQFYFLLFLLKYQKNRNCKGLEYMKQSTFQKHFQVPISIACMIKFLEKQKRKDSTRMQKTTKKATPPKQALLTALWPPI